MPATILAKLCNLAHLWRGMKEEMAAADEETIDDAICALAEGGLGGPAIFELLNDLLGSRRAIQVWSARRNTLGNPLWFRQFGRQEAEPCDTPWLNWGRGFQ